MKTADRRLIRILALLAGMIAVLIVLDKFPYPLSLPSLPTFMLQKQAAHDRAVADALRADPDTLPPLPPASIGTKDVSGGTDDIPSLPPESGEASDDTPTGQEPAVPLPDENTLVLTFLGSCAPGSPLGSRAFGSLNLTMEEQGAAAVFAGLRDYLIADDRTVAANVAVLSDSAAAFATARCIAPASAAALYAGNSVELVSLIGYSAEPEAYADTAAALSAAGSDTFTEGERIVIEEKGFRVSLIGAYLTRIGGRSAEIAEIRQAAKDSDFVIVYYAVEPDDGHLSQDWLDAILRAYADAGASLLIGVGGTLRPAGTYDDTLIASSLGTLLDGSTLTAENVSALLRVSLTRGENGAAGISTEWIPCTLYADNLWSPAVMPEGDARDRVLAYLAGDVYSPHLAS